MDRGRRKEKDSEGKGEEDTGVRRQMNGKEEGRLGKGKERNERGNKSKRGEGG